MFDLRKTENILSALVILLTFERNHMFSERMERPNRANTWYGATHVLKSDKQVLPLKYPKYLSFQWAQEASLSSNITLVTWYAIFLEGKPSEVCHSPEFVELLFECQRKCNRAWPWICQCLRSLNSTFATLLCLHSFIRYGFIYFRISLINGCIQAQVGAVSRVTCQAFGSICFMGTWKSLYILQKSCRKN